MSRKRISLPKATKIAFLNVAKGNVDANGQLKETLCFLAGYETEQELIVTDLIFPVQEGTSAKVDDLGICGQDSTFWISQQSPAAQHHGSSFRIIAWVHSHVCGALCGFSSIDVHAQYAYRTLYHEWNVYGLVYEIRDDGSSISDWLDITQEGKKVISKCSVTQVQHGSCSARHYFESHSSLVDELLLPLTVVDARNSAPLGSNVNQHNPTIHILDPVQSSQSSNFKDHDVCKSCGKYVGSSKSLVGHIGHSKKCKVHYGEEYEYMKQRNRAESVKTYNKKNAVKMAEKQDIYNQKNRANISKKQKKYDEDHRDQVNKKQKVYNKANREKISEKQKEYDEDHRDQVNEKQKVYNKANREKISEKQKKYDEDHRDQVNEKQKVYNKANREKISKQQKKYNEDHRHQVNENQKVYNKANRENISKKQKKYDEDHRDQVNKKQTLYNKANREKISEKQKKYDKDHRDQVNEKQKVYNKANREKIAKQQRKYNEDHRDVINATQQEYNNENREAIAEKQRKYNLEHKAKINEKQDRYNKQNAAKIAGKEAKRKTAKRNSFKDFNTNIAKGPIFPCVSCHRLLFSNGVISYSSEQDMSSVIDKTLLNNSIKVTDKMFVDHKIFLCINCNLLLKKGKMPCTSIQNGLFLDDIPNELRLTELEQQLIAKRLLFLKIHLLPRSRMPAMKDRVINVPLEDHDIIQTIDSLPRKPDYAGLVTVKFKRMKKLKSNHSQAFVRPGVSLKALQKLKELGHPDYQFSFVEEKDVEMIDICSSSSEESDEEDANQSQSLHELYNTTTCLVHDNLETEIVINKDQTPKSIALGKNIIEIAPGEGKIPTNILTEDNIDVKAFPTLFPTGKFGCDYPRENNISKQKYFNQRLLNIDSRFRENATYLFAAQHIVEREQLEKNINLMVQKGQLRRGSDGSHIMTTTDNYAAFQNIRGSPKYFQTARNELLARVAQLGPFQFFFTLSCAEMRWPEILATLLQQRGHKVCCTDEQNLEYTVEGLPLEEFLDQAKINRHDLFRNNIFTVTRMFDQRVKSFINHIFPTLSKQVPTDCYSYRIEYQMRGAAHVHGVLWLDAQAMEFYKIPNSNLYNSEKICDLIDDVVTCELPENDDNLKATVEQVQFHHHTKSCKKYNNGCRFGYPRFPSNKTMVAKPLPSELNASEQKTIMEGHKSVLKKVKAILETDELSSIPTIENLVTKAGVTLSAYEKALSVSERGVNIVLKRKVNECYINNYNPMWLKAWNANMDIQFCYDPYAVITYICDYYGKDDSGMTELLKEALRKVKGDGKHEILQTLKKTYLTHRQIGACEATYRMLPNLHMKDSNVTCTFVSTGFPENRAMFMEKVAFDDEELAYDETTAPIQTKYIKIEGKKGLYKKRVSVYERYSQRPIALKKMCLAQFATMYKVTSYEHKKIVMESNSSVQTSNITIYLTDNELPLKIQFDNTELSQMQLRGRPSVLRLHESKKKKEEHEFYYSELLLFHPWQNETAQLYRNDVKKCKALYKKYFTEISERRKKMFPYLDSVEEAMARLEESSLQDVRPSHITDNLDIEGEHENEDDQLIGHQEAEFALPYPEHIENATEAHHKDIMQFKVVPIDIEEMMSLTRQLIPEQMLVLNVILEYCKKTQRSHINGSNSPDPVRLILHGGAGSGKSNVIRIVSRWAEKILRKAGDHPNKPRVLLTAPTGTAASIIGGTTLHSAFSFSFGDDLKPLSDKKLDDLRCTLSDVKLVIVDEISMMRSDMLYQLHVRLCEIFQCKELFGNRSLLLVGDLLQLQPVRGSYIFQPPHSPRYKPYHTVTPLWEEFQVAVLNHNHRQGEAGFWADSLNRFRIGEVSDSDLAMLTNKVISEVEAKMHTSACHLFFTNKEVDNHNNEMINKLQEKLHIIKAAVTVPFGCKSRAESTGRIDQTAFMSSLKVKKGARIMLIHNIDVCDNLTNGAMGQILDVRKQEDKVHCIIVTFDNPEVGANQREKYSHISNLYKESTGTPIFKVEVQYQLPRGKGGSKQHTASGKLYQFPLRLAWAVTSHKVQGQTFKKNSKNIVHWHKNLSPGMAYVMLGRCENPDDVLISGQFDKKGIKCNSKAKDMSQQLSLRSKAFPQKSLWNEEKCTKIVLSNVRSIKSHANDLLMQPGMQEVDIMCTTETWLRADETYNILEDKFKHAAFASYKDGRGKGCAIFSRLKITEVVTVQEQEFQLIQAFAANVQIILLYKCQGPGISKLIQYLQNHISYSKPTIILGDFNIAVDSQKRLKTIMDDHNMVQIVMEPTHDAGNTLDHVYVSRTMLSACSYLTIPVFFSDHDLLQIKVVN